MQWITGATVVDFNFVATLDAGVPHMAGITDLHLFRRGDATMLYSASEADGGLTAFAVAPGESAVFADQIGAALNRGTYGLSAVDTVTAGGQSVLVPAGRHDDRLAFHKLDSAGKLNGVQILGGDTALLGNLEELLTLQIEDKTFMVASQWGQSGFRSYRIRDELSVEHKRHFADTDTAHVVDVTAMASVEVDGRNYFFTASAAENGVTAWWMGRWGNIKERGSLDSEDGLWVSAPSALDTAIVDGTAYLLLGASGSDSLTVMKVNQWGGLFVKDHEIDTLGTRFAGVGAVESFAVGERSFVLAGGSDDGVTLFELAPGGKLLERATIADSVDTRLSSVSAIETAVFGSEVQVFVSAGDDSGVTQFALDLGDLGASVTGWNADDTLTGTGADDIMMGYDGDDTISGGDGDDTLIDGPGVDVLTGGPGADSFVFLEDRRMDIVTDFTPGEDRLDLSDFPLLHGIERLDFTQKLYGVLISYGDDRFRIEAEGTQLMVGDLSADDFLF